MPKITNWSEIEPPENYDNILKAWKHDMMNITIYVTATKIGEKRTYDVFGGIGDMTKFQLRPKKKDQVVNIEDIPTRKEAVERTRKWLKNNPYAGFEDEYGAPENLGDDVRCHECGSDYVVDGECQDCGTIAIDRFV